MLESDGLWQTCQLETVAVDPPEQTLPTGWKEYLDPASRLPYYHHAATNNTQWEKPMLPAATRTSVPEPRPPPTCLQEQWVDKEQILFCSCCQAWRKYSEYSKNERIVDRRVVCNTCRNTAQGSYAYELFRRERS